MTRHIKNIVKKVNWRLGFDGKATNADNIKTLTFDDIKLMYTICSFQKGFHPERVSYFCAPFDRDDLKVILFWAILNATHNK